MEAYSPCDCQCACPTFTEGGQTCMDCLSGIHRGSIEVGYDPDPCFDDEEIQQ